MEKQTMIIALVVLCICCIVSSVIGVWLLSEDKEDKEDTSSNTVDAATSAATTYSYKANRRGAGNIIKDTELNGFTSDATHPGCFKYNDVNSEFEQMQKACSDDKRCKAFVIKTCADGCIAATENKMSDANVCYYDSVESTTDGGNAFNFRSKN